MSVSWFAGDSFIRPTYSGKYTLATHTIVKSHRMVGVMNNSARTEIQSASCDDYDTDDRAGSDSFKKNVRIDWVTELRIESFQLDQSRRYLDRALASFGSIQR